jgi:hypothetical protein
VALEQSMQRRILCMRISNGLGQARQRSTPWQRDYLLRSGRVKS